LSSPFAEQRTFLDYQKLLDDGVPGALEPSAVLEDREIVTKTWELSLAQLARSNVPQARAILEVLAWFKGAVPIFLDMLDRDILTRSCSVSGPKDIDKGLAALLSVGLIETSFVSSKEASRSQNDKRAIMLHPLVAEITRHRLSDTEAVSSAFAAAELLGAAAAGISPDDNAGWARIFPHFEAVVLYPKGALEGPRFVPIYTSMKARAIYLSEEIKRIRQETARLRQETARLRGSLEEDPEQDDKDELIDQKLAHLIEMGDRAVKEISGSSNDSSEE
jgi:hypothetical protein